MPDGCGGLPAVCDEELLLQLIQYSATEAISRRATKIQTCLARGFSLDIQTTLADVFPSVPLDLRLQVNRSEVFRWTSYSTGVTWKRQGERFIRYCGNKAVFSAGRVGSSGGTSISQSVARLFRLSDLDLFVFP
jgi:hypothetical protein